MPKRESWTNINREINVTEGQEISHEPITFLRERKELSNDPDNVYLKHKEDETVSDYQSEISYSHWNDKDIKSRNPFNRKLSVSADINPLKGLLKNN